MRILAHLTPRKNLRRIAREGLRSNVGGGNYYGSRWESLDGTYLTPDAALLTHMLENRDDLKAFGIVLVEADPSTLLPDEDAIDIILGMLRKRIEVQTNPTPSRRRLKTAMIAEFHDMASNGDKVQKDARLLANLVENYLQYDDGEDIENDEWLVAKDRVARTYGGIRNPLSPDRESFRHPDDIGFEGRTRILAVIDAKTGKVVKGIVPAAAEPLLDAIFDRESAPPDSATRAERQELLAIAIRVLPSAASADLSRRIADMTDDEVRSNLKTGREKVATMGPEIAPEPAPPPAF